MEFPRICPARWLSDDGFGMCGRRDYLCPFYDMHSNYFRPWKLYDNQSVSKEFGSTIENEKGNYKITLDVQHFRPSDISVKVTDTEIIVEGKHEDRPDAHGFISRQFRRRYPLPSNCPPENVTSSMSSDGVLTIISEKVSKGVEKIVPIKMCGTIPRKTQIETKTTSEVTQNSFKENNKDIEDKACSLNKTQILHKEEHSRLLKPELLKEAISDTNGEKMSSKQVIEITSTTPEKKATPDIGATSNKIEETIAKSIMGLSELTEQLGQRSLASTSDSCAMKSSTNSSKTLIEESSSSYKSSSTMCSTIKTSGKIGEYVSDIISAELKEAAENV
ncbi:heat shock protein 67B1-like [Helicoverpa zea]|uniref:heat shock protein 67B1-like n=1 Tax=Helicoverpa zea TaxID=7113 RepID=UPI001F57B091|nr:heat shock protein 67B1-like [Helicoverpa zea]